MQKQMKMGRRRVFVKLFCVEEADVCVRVRLCVCLVSGLCKCVSDWDIL